jgi:hypothetical protein
MVQLDKQFPDSQVKELLERYLKKEIEIRYVPEIQGTKKSGFFSCSSNRGYPALQLFLTGGILGNDL